MAKAPRAAAAPRLQARSGPARHARPISSTNSATSGISPRIPEVTVVSRNRLWASAHPRVASAMSAGVALVR